MNDVTFIILKLVISICAALITAYVIPYIKTLRNNKRYASLLDIVEVAVKAAEQSLKNETGEFKKSEVLAYVCHWLEQNGIKVEMEQLDKLIECAVYQMKQEG
jgi:LL-H family phage holin